MNKSAEVVITGVAPISALGCGRVDFWRRLIAGDNAFGPVTRFDVANSPSKIGAEIENFSLDSYLERGGALSRQWPRPLQLAFAAAILAVQDAGVNVEEDSERIGTILGTALGNLSEIFSMKEHFSRTGSCRPNFGFYTVHHSMACLISASLDFRGPVHTLSTGCNSTFDAIGMAKQVILSGGADIVVVVGSDCDLVPEVFAGLNASRSLSSKYNDQPARASRPFDRNRDGNVLGEGAGAFVLESRAHAARRGARVYAVVNGSANRAAGRGRRYSHDNPDLGTDACTRALSATLHSAGWRPDEVELFNANGSSSVLYDVLEAQAFRELLGGDATKVPVHSIKGALGQHGAGTSAFQVISACLSLSTGIVPPTLNFEEPDPACGPLDIVTRASELKPRKILTHAIGFGGFYFSGLALSAADENWSSTPPEVVWSSSMRARPRALAPENAAVRDCA